MSRLLAVCVLLSIGLLPASSQARKWTDSTGQYVIEADQVAFNATTVVVKKRNRELVALPIDKLSPADQEYLKSKPAAEAARAAADQAQTWTLRNGLKLVGCVVDYARKDVTVARRRGSVYVNERRLDNLPEIYRRLLPKIVAYFENTPIDGEAGLQRWVDSLNGQGRTYRLEGVMMELEGGDEYGIPFFAFSDEDLKILKPGWERWLAAVNQRERDKQGHEAFLLQAQAQAYQQDRSATQLIAALHLDLKAFQAGEFDLWEVMLYPGLGVSGTSISVVVPARDSRGAGKEARKQHPGYELGPISKVSRRN
jgi:hypothetical protein